MIPNKKVIPSVLLQRVRNSYQLFFFLFFCLCFSHVSLLFTIHFIKCPMQQRISGYITQKKWKRLFYIFVMVVMVWSYFYYYSDNVLSFAMSGKKKIWNWVASVGTQMTFFSVAQRQRSFILLETEFETNPSRLFVPTCFYFYSTIN